MGRSGTIFILFLIFGVEQVHMYTHLICATDPRPRGALHLLYSTNVAQPHLSQHVKSTSPLQECPLGTDALLELLALSPPI